MKKRIIAILLSLVLVLSIAVVAAFAKNRPAAENAENVKDNIPVAQVKPNAPVEVSLDAAIDIALEDAGVKRDEALLIGSPSLDKDDKKLHYDVEFKHNGIEYEYEVAVDNGAVIKVEKDKDKPIVNKDNGKAEKIEVEKPSAPVVVNPDKEYISIEKAKEIALENAGVKPADAVFKKAYYDADDLVAHFDIKFVANGYEYEYEIKASNGAILEKDIEREPVRVEKEPVREQVPQAPEKEFISQENAKEIAFNHAKVDSANVKHLKVELDRDDLIAHYEIEFVEGRYEYEYEINAESGKIIANDKDFNDWFYLI